MLTQTHTKNVAVFSASHFLVDFACAFIVFLKLYGDDNWVTYLLVYNACAFALQLPLGIIIDRYENNSLFASLGALLVAGAFMLTTAPYFMVVLLGLGNAFFHVGAGRDVLLAGRGKYTQLGVFVSPGAVGLFCGTLLGKAELGSKFYAMIIIAVLLLITAGLMLKLRDCERERNMPASEPTAWIALALAALFVVVCLRSYVGMALSFPWKTTIWFSLASVLALAGGKALGGVLADRFGAVRTSVVSLALCAVLALMWENPACGLASILLFNMTMPISLGAVYKHLPDWPGAGFGLLTFALFIGALPAMTGTAGSWFMPYGFAIAGVLSAVLLWLGLREKRHA